MIKSAANESIKIFFIVLFITIKKWSCYERANEKRIKKTHRKKQPHEIVVPNEGSNEG